MGMSIIMFTPFFSARRWASHCGNVSHVQGSMVFIC